MKLKSMSSIPKLAALRRRLTGLKKKNLVSKSSRSDRVAMVEWEEAELSVKTQAELLGLSRSSLYYKPVPPSEEEIAN